MKICEQITFLTNILTIFLGSFAFCPALDIHCHASKCRYWKYTLYLNIHCHTSKCRYWEIHLICVYTVMQVNAGIGNTPYIWIYTVIRVNAGIGKYLICVYTVVRVNAGLGKYTLYLQIHCHTSNCRYRDIYLICMQNEMRSRFSFLMHCG